jgi:glycosyltransferase involved in cell wall biosynthesis
VKIVFINISSEPGRDGVGDYTRGFAAELLGLGHDVRFVAINDRFVGAVVEEEQIAGTKRVRTLRLPARKDWDDRISLGAAFMDGFQPDWVSLQFVCYGFHKKGFVHGLAKRMKPLLKGRKLDMMFHELWIGEEVGSGLKNRMVGAVQRFFIRGLVRKLRPDVIHTSNAPYQAILARDGIPAGILPLFGAIPLVEKPDFGWIEKHVRAATGGDFQREGFWIFGMFGGLTSNWPPEPLLSRILDAARRAGKKVVMVSIGRIGGGESVWERMARDYGDRMAFVRLGQQEPTQVSELLTFLDYGIAASPWLVLGKSSTSASMLEHGLPVIVNRDDVRFRIQCDGPDDPLLIQCDGNLEARLIAGVPKGPARLRREQIVRDFVRSLDQSPASAPRTGPFPGQTGQ